MLSAVPSEQVRLRRLLDACCVGLNHDLTNQLITLRALLQFLEQDEAKNLSATGQDYVRRLLGVSVRTQALAHTLRDLSRLGGAPPPSEALALPTLIEEVVAELQPLRARVYAWEAPRVFAPRALVRQAVGVALALLVDLDGNAGSTLDFRSHLAGPAIELALGIGPLAGKSAPIPSATSVVEMPKPWHDRLECVLLRELAKMWDGEVRWQKDQNGVRVVLLLPAPR